MSKVSKVTGNPTVSFRAPEQVLGEIQERQDALTAQMSAGGDAPLGSTARRDLERYYAVVRDSLRHLPLSRGEVLLILDAMNGTIVDPPSMYRGSVLLNVADHIKLNRADEKWGVDGDGLVRKLNELGSGAQMSIVDMAERFWSRADEDADEVLRELGVGAWLRDDA